jgi:hypothetical protein
VRRQTRTQDAGKRRICDRLRKTRSNKELSAKARFGILMQPWPIGPRALVQGIKLLNPFKT